MTWMPEDSPGMAIAQFENGYWYVIDRLARMTVAISLTRDDAVAKCRTEGWKIGEIVPLAA